MCIKLKILLAKTGLDPHDKGIKLVAHAMSEEMKIDVFYTGLYRSIEEIVEEAIRRDVDIVGLGVHTGQQMTLFPELRGALSSAGGSGIILIGGGVMPEKDIDSLKKTGCVSGIFSHNNTIKDIMAWLDDLAAKRQSCVNHR